MPSPFSFNKIKEYTGHRGAVYTLVPGSKAGHFLSAGSDGNIVEWETESGDGEVIVKCPSPVFSLRLLPERNLLVAGTQQGNIYFIDTAAKKVLSAFEAHARGVFDFLPWTDHHLISSGSDGRLHVWNLDTLKSEGAYQHSAYSIRTMILHPEQGLICGDSGGNIILLDQDLTHLQTYPAHKLSVFRLLWNEVTGKLYSTGRDAHLSTWNLSEMTQPVKRVAAHLFAVNDIIRTHEGEFLITGSMDKSLRMWQTQDLELVAVADYQRHGGHKFGINRLLSMEGLLFSCGDDGVIMSWGVNLQPDSGPE